MANEHGLEVALMAMEHLLSLPSAGSPHFTQHLGAKGKICLIIPPSVFLLDERVFVSLGILRVAAVLERAGYPVEVLDLSGIDNYVEVALHYAREKQEVGWYGITCTTPQLPATVKIIQALRSQRTSARIILGGPHVTLVHAAHKRKKPCTNNRAAMALEHLVGLFDVLVAGDGEEAVFFALESNAPKIVDADDPRSPLFLNNARLNTLPFPARNLVDMDSYRYFIEGVRATSLIAQLGCPFECGFCGGRMSPMLRRVRMRTSENIVEEMKYIHRTYGIRGFMFYDDELNVNTKMVELMQRIAQIQKELGVEFRLRGFVKSELFTEEQARAMYEAGFRWILVGFESGSPRILKNINKRASQAENTRCLEIARRNGLKVKVLMSLGHPGETPETLQETFEWLRAVRPDDFDATIITCYPGTPYYDFAEPDPQRPGVWIYTYPETGDRLHQVEVDYTVVADYYKGNPEGGYTSYVFTDELSREDLVRERDRMEKELRRILGIPFPPSAQAVRYEHSMGQQGFPPFLLRASKPDPALSL